MTTQPLSASLQGASSDFDFLFGRWRVRHRRLQTRLSGADDWQEFEGSCEARPLLGGLANIDDNLLELPAGHYRAASLRTFDPATRQWSIWWLDGRQPGQLDVPVRGGFVDGEGLFFAEDRFEGRDIRVRFRWRPRGPAGPLWEQAFSADAGQSWETNWSMRFERSLASDAIAHPG
jgi:hypothetical protein